MNDEGRYLIDKSLGTGGFGSVYKAHDTKLHRDVALKRLNKGECDTKVREQLLKEARVLATMHHPNIVSVFDVSSHEEFDQIVMELAVGVSFDRLVKRHLLLQQDFQQIASQILNALSVAHEAGILHCDLKPENIMLCMASGNKYGVKLYDFGMSHSLNKEKTAENAKLMGSIYVMAPELFNGEKPTEQSDLYALGCVFYYLLTGSYPFCGDSSIQVMAMHISGKYTPLADIRADLSSEFCAWIEALIASDKSARPASCSEALDQLSCLELPTEEADFSLPTDLEIDSVGSRVVRSIGPDSLALPDGVQKDCKLANFSNKTVTHSAPMKVRTKIELGNKIAPSPLSKAESAALPEDAEWYFSTGESARGPVSLKQLQKLCATNVVTPESLLWHPHFGEWISAGSCADTRDSFGEVQKAGLEDLLKDVEWQKTAGIRPPVIGVEVLVVVIGALISGGFLYLHPGLLPLIAAIYALILFFVGFVSSRLCQLRSGLWWFIFCLVIPVLGDIVHAIMRPSVRVVVCAMMFIVGGLSLGLICLGEEISVMASRPATDVDVEYLRSAMLVFLDL